MPGSVFHVDELAALVGSEVTSSWVRVSQETIDRFADLSGDRQWIHVDPERSRRDSPYGTTVAHGFLTVALMSRLLRDAVKVDGVSRAINYGLNRVRFPAPLPAGSEVRGRFALLGAEPIEGGVKVAWSAAVEPRSGGKPCCAAEWLVRYFR